MNGKIVKLTDKGYGFIEPEGKEESEKDLFFHSNDLQNTSFDELKEGTEVTFDLEESDKGKNAVNINVK